MEEDELIIIVACIIVIVLTILCGLIWRCVKKSRNEQPKYEITDNYSSVGSEFVFDQTKNSKVWIGQSGFTKMEKEQHQQRLSKQYSVYAAAMRIATNYCRDPAFVGQRKIRDDLPCIGYRNDVKFFYPVSDTRLEKDIIGDAMLLEHIDVTKCPINIPNILNSDDITQCLGDFRCIDFNIEEQFRAFRLTLETLDHPYIARTYEVGQSRDKNHIFIFRDFFEKGSLRDHIYSVDLSQPYSEKYNRRSNGLEIPLIRKYGRQILEGMNYLSKCGIVHYHLHSGNILIHYTDNDGNIKSRHNSYGHSNSIHGHNQYHSQTSQSLADTMNSSFGGMRGSRSKGKNKKYDNGKVQLTDIENNFLGLIPKHPYYKHICTLKKLYPNLNVELMMFGYILFEMVCGVESPVPSPLDCIHEIETTTSEKIPMEIKDILGRIFGDKSLGDTPTLDDIIGMPFFSAKNAPVINTGTYDSLRSENEFVEKMRNISVIQCYNTYSAQTLQGANQDTMTDMNQPKKRKKRKKKKKKNASNLNASGKLAGSVASSKAPSLVDANLLDDEDDDDDEFDGFG